MRLKTKLWIAAGLVSLMLVIMVGIVYVKGRSTIINIANTEGERCLLHAFGSIFEKKNYWL